MGSTVSSTSPERCFSSSHSIDTDLIRFRIVFHGFIDGYSRLVTGLRASNNNRANTVLELFLEAIQVHGCPAKVRGDHGVENLRVAEYMEENFGIGTYLWGKSVHNIRIERLWFDLTNIGIGHKWKEFFVELEVHWGLLVDMDIHIWLLHHLFLGPLNAELDRWTATWNHHNLSIRDERTASPHSMFFFGAVTHGIFGPPGMQEVLQDHVSEEDLASYGLDWEDLGDRQIRAHHISENNLLDDAFEGEPSIAGQPSVPVAQDNVPHTHRPVNLASVEVPAIESDLALDSVSLLDDYLANQGLDNLDSSDMASRRNAWVLALQWCQIHFPDVFPLHW
jgi:hypothetical protein